MRKRNIAAAMPVEARPAGAPLDLNSLAVVEVTSEDENHTVEGALLPEASTGWRAAAPGPQTVRVIFDEPQAIRRVSLVFEEEKTQRTQEFVLRWSPDT